MMKKEEERTMKERLLAFMLASLLLVSLTACGEKKEGAGSGEGSSDMTQEQQNTHNGSEETVPGAAKGRTWSSDARSGNRYGSNEQFNNNYGSTFGGIGGDGAVYSGNGSYGSDRTAAWQQMLENGRVDDDDGFLLRD